MLCVCTLCLFHTRHGFGQIPGIPAVSGVPPGSASCAEQHVEPGDSLGLGLRTNLPTAGPAAASVLVPGSFDQSIPTEVTPQLLLQG